MKTALVAAAQKRVGRARGSSLSAIPPAENSREYDPELAGIAASILYCSPEPTESGRPVYILNAAAFPDAADVDYDSLLSYVLARLPDEDELLAGTEYEIIFFAGGPPESASADKRQGPGMGWYLQAYHVLSRALRKKLQRLYIVHPRTWVRVLIGIFGTVVSPKFRRKIVTCNTLSMLALHFPIDRLLIPPSTYLHDRKVSDDIYVPYASGRRAFGARRPFPKDIVTGTERLPRVLRETTTFILLESNITTEGIFRIPPHATTVNVLKEAYDRGQRFIVWKEPRAVFAYGLTQERISEIRLEDAYSVQSAASLIKAWYRDLQQPIFPSSTYQQLRAQFGDVNTAIKSESLAALLTGSSSNPILSTESQQVMTRHLLPLTAAVAARSSQNKMNAENLAICFSMNLICGPNQVEDMQIAQIIRRVLQKAIEAWSEIRNTLQLDQDMFIRDLQPPKNSRNYEDPLDTGKHNSPAVNDGPSGEHRIGLTDNDNNASSKVNTSIESAPVLPPRPQPDVNLAIASSDPATSIKRKPAPAPLPPSPSEELLRELAPQSIPCESNHSIADATRQPAGLPNSSVPVEEVKTVGEAKNVTFLNELNALMSIPKRKAISREVSAQGTDRIVPIASDNRDAQQNEAATSNDLVADSSTPFSEKSPTDESFAEETFRKPAFPASVTRKALNIQSLAKPVNPATYPGAATIPVIIQPSKPALANSSVPKHRGPSPGLLARMSSAENINKNESQAEKRPTLEPRRLNMRKSSVDDLRRLYEERTVTAQGLAQAQALRRSSSSASAGV